MSAPTFSAGRPKSCIASMHSMPLFISVALSIVIFGPIFQTGWLRASAAVTFYICSAVQSRNGPPDAVSHTRETSAFSVSRRHCHTALCTLSLPGAAARAASRAA